MLGRGRLTHQRRVPVVDLPGASIAYDVVGEGEPVLLLAGCGEPAAAWGLTTPALTAAGYQVVTLDNRGVAPSSAPPAPYSIDQMVADALGVLDHLGLGAVRVVGNSMGGWIAETMAVTHPERVVAAAFIASCNESTAWERASLELARDLARLDVDLPRRVDAVDTLHYLTPSDLQRDEVVQGWLSILDDIDPWRNPGRLGQLEACCAWAADPGRTARWAALRAPVLVVAFELDIDSPPDRARAAAAQIPGARVVEIAGAGHLGVVTHTEQVNGQLLAFFARR